MIERFDMDLIDKMKGELFGLMSDGDELLEAMLCFRVFAFMTLLRLDGV